VERFGKIKLPSNLKGGIPVQYLLSVSKIMKAGEVKQACIENKSNLAHIVSLEFQIKEELKSKFVTSK
jgi:hypothetical protein